jgi:hypothetical protein
MSLELFHSKKSYHYEAYGYSTAGEPFVSKKRATYVLK